jgi:hypothetical protein
MSKTNFKMTVDTDDATGAILAVYFQIREGIATVVKEVAKVLPSRTTTAWAAC